MRWWNGWLERHSGLSAAEVMGRSRFEIYPDLEPREPGKALRRVRDSGESVVLSHRLHSYFLLLPPPAAHAGFPHMQQSALMSPLRHQGEIAGAITLIEDVAERVAYEMELHQRIQSLDRANAEVRAAPGAQPPTPTHPALDRCHRSCPGPPLRP